ncbi:MAG: phenylalanine--tRNA ligase subunit beta [Candidatus Paceibacterota bacterium]
MKISRNWLQTFFDTPLPGVEKLENALTFHSSEIEEIMVLGTDEILDVKVLPDKSAWMLSHRGVAKEIATILNIPMRDPLQTTPQLLPKTEQLIVTRDTEKCIRYTAALIHDIAVGPSPQWLKERLTAIGQHSINNVVDITNYVMFHLGQPLHAFDANKLMHREGVREIGVRMAVTGEKIVTLSGEERTLTSDDMVIIDKINDMPIGIAGVKGGESAEVDDNTTSIVIESANFDRVSVRKTAQRHKLRTDASARYENGVVPELAGYGLELAVALLQKVTGGSLVGYVDDTNYVRTQNPISVSLEKINSVLGLELTDDDVRAIFARFGYAFVMQEAVLTVTPPFERDDLNIEEDLIEEVGRLHGLVLIPSHVPDTVPLTEYNSLFIYAEQVRVALTSIGFSEVYTSSFRNKDIVKLANSLAADKNYLRSNLYENLSEALDRNIHNKDLLGLSRIMIFEIGTVFDTDGEHVSLAFGVRTNATYSPKKDDTYVSSAIDALKDIFGPELFEIRDGIAEVNVTTAIADLPEQTKYVVFNKGEDITYRPFSMYPHTSRDIAVWAKEGTSAEAVEEVINEHAGKLRVRTTFFDEFHKEDKVSYAFRIVFQSTEKTLTDEEIHPIMDRMYKALSENGWEIR